MFSRGIRPLAAAVILGLAGSFTALPVYADDAASLFRQGQEAYSNGDVEGAYEKYKEAWALKQSYDIAGNLGNVEVKLKKYADAVPHLQFVLDNLPVSMDTETREAVTKRTSELLAQAKAQVAVIRFSITPSNAAVTVNGKKVEGTEVVVNPGPVNVAITADGYRTIEKKITVGGGATQNEAFTMQPLDPNEPPPPPPDSGADDGPSVPIIIAGGVLGVGAIVGGAVLHVVASGKGSDREDLAAPLDAGFCAQNPTQSVCTEIDDLASQESTFSGAGTGLLIGGGVIVAATVTYWLWPRGGDENTAFSISPVLSPGFIGATGEF